MKSKKFIATMLAATVVATTALVGCGNKSGGGNNTTGTAAGPDKDQYLNLILAQEPKTIDPSKATDLYSSQIIIETQEALTRIVQDENNNDKIEPAGAEKWDTSSDGLTWTFHLRDNTWTDGKKVTAQDYEYGIKRTLDPAIASQYAFLLYPIKGAQEYNSKKGSADAVGVKALDDKTLQITLANPTPYFLNLTYFKVMTPQRKDIVEKNGDKYGSEANTLVFSGPFVLKDWVHSNSVSLEKNDKYWDAKSVKLSKVTMKIIKDETARMNELLNGSIDSAAVRLPEWKGKFDQTGKFDLIKGYNADVAYQFGNQKTKLFSNAKVRQAFSLAITRDDIAKTLYKGVAEGAYAWAPPQLQLGGKDFRQQANQLPVKDLAAANADPKALFVEGLKELGMDTDPSKITVTFLESGTDAQAREFAEYFQQMYQKALGINMKIDYVEWPVFQKRTDSYDYELAGMAWGGDYNDPMTFFDMFLSDAGIVPTGWSNKTYDDLINQAKTNSDPNARLDAFKKAEKILIQDEAVVAPTVWRLRQTYRYKYVKNLYAPLFGSGSEFKYAYTEGRAK